MEKVETLAMSAFDFSIYDLPFTIYEKKLETRKPGGFDKP